MIPDPGRREVAERILGETHYVVQVPAFVNRYLVIPPHRMREASREAKDGCVRVVTEIDTPKGTLTAVTERNATSATEWTTKYPCESVEDIAKIRSIPSEPVAELAPPDMSNVPEDFNRRGVMRVNVSSPMVCVAGMMPYEYYLELCGTNLTLIKALTSICLERIMNRLDILLSEGNVDWVWMGGCEWLTPPMGSPELYEALVQEFERPVIERIHAGGALSQVHCHGNVRSTLEAVIERGADFFEPVEPPPDGDITMAEAKAAARGRITLGGNVESRVIEHGSLEEVEAATRAAFEGGKERMVLQPTAHPICALTPKMLENYHRMVDVWEELSPVG